MRLTQGTRYKIKANLDETVLAAPEHQFNLSKQVQVFKSEEAQVHPDDQIVLFALNSILATTLQSLFSEENSARVSLISALLFNTLVLLLGEQSYGHDVTASLTFQCQMLALETILETGIHKAFN